VEAAVAVIQRWVEEAQ